MAMQMLSLSQINYDQRGMKRAEESYARNARKCIYHGMAINNERSVMSSKKCMSVFVPQTLSCLLILPLQQLQMSS